MRCVAFNYHSPLGQLETYSVTYMFQSAFETLQQHLPEMKRHADIIVVCYHGGFEKDLESGTPTQVLTGENEGYAMLVSVF